MTLAHSCFHRQSDLLVKLNRLLERCLRNSKCIDTESLCVVAGEKVGNMPKILNLGMNIVDSWISISILSFSELQLIQFYSSSLHFTYSWMLPIELCVISLWRDKKIGENSNLDLYTNFLFKELVVFHIFSFIFLCYLSELIEAGNVFLFYGWRAKELIESFIWIGLLTYTGLHSESLVVRHWKYYSQYIVLFDDIRTLFLIRVF